ncbi:MAG: hypothetical protein QW719_03225 [Candidatus Micrarchaeaceae archaeon]
MGFTAFEREFACPSCNSVFDRGVTSAAKIKRRGALLWKIGETLVEDYASTSSMLEYIKSIPHVKASIAVEARNPIMQDGLKSIHNGE